MINLFVILLIVTPWCATAASDLESLLSFTNATTNKPSSWSPSNTDPCSWTGVSCYNGQTGIVTSIRINCTQSESGFRTDFGGVLNFTLLPSNLTTLIVSNCRALTGNVFQPGGYSYPNSIHTIVITNNTNMMRAIDLTQLPSQLQYLDLSDNAFTATGQQLDVSNLPRTLKNISLRGNLFDSLNFTNLPHNLTHVDFSNWNGILTFEPPLVLSINSGIPQSLQSFNIRNSLSQTVDLSQLTSLPISLQYLDVSSSAQTFQTVDLRHLPPNLQFLNLDQTFVTLIGDLNSLPKSLEQLALYNLKYDGGRANKVPFGLNLCSLPNNLRVLTMNKLDMASFGGIIQGGTTFCDKDVWSQKQLQMLTMSNSQWNTNITLEAFPSSLQELHAVSAGLTGDLNLTVLAEVFPNLQVFNIAQNELSGTLSFLHPSTLPRNLETLRIDHNSFQGFIDFDALPKSLRQLNVAGNSICSAGSTTLALNTTGSWCSTF
eukprot:PhF_6_TR26141/c0_g1_i6/m.37025